MGGLNRRTLLAAAAGSPILMSAGSFGVGSPEGDTMANGGGLFRARRPRPPISSTFLQPLNRMRGRSSDSWLAELAELKALGCEKIYLQWTEVNRSDFIDDGRKADRWFLTPFLDAATRANIKIAFGLSADLTQQGHYSATPKALAAMLAERRDASLRQAKRLYQVAGQSPVFSGWYLPEEIDDETISDRARAAVWMHHLSTQLTGLDAVARDAEVAISTYVSGHLTPTQLAEFWASVWASRRITLLLQDGFGARHLKKPEQIADYMSAIDGAARPKNAQWGIIVELFEQTSGPPIDDQSYSARPTSIDRLAFQIALAKRFPSAVCSSYSMQEHMLGKAGTQATVLANGYKRRYVDDQDAGPQRSSRPERSATVR